MDINSKNQEEISLCYFNAVAAKANTIININRRDEDGIDANIKKEVITKDGVPFFSELNFQIKSVYSNGSYGRDSDNNIFYDLKVKNYNNLVKKAAIGRYLVLLILPFDNNDWVNQTEDFLSIKKCMYYISMKNKEKSSNVSTVRITIPKENIFDYEHLIMILKKEADGDD